MSESKRLSHLSKLREREMELERALDEMPSRENAMEAELNYVRDRITNLEVQTDLQPGETFIGKINRETDEKIMDLIDENRKYKVADASAFKGSVLKGKKKAEENPMTAAEIVKRRYQDGWNDYSALLRVKRGVEEGKWGNENELYHLNARLNELKPENPVKPLINKLGEDPNGIGQHEPGSKLDAGKLRAGLAFSDFPRAMKAWLEVISYGVDKYTASGWLSVPEAETRYKDALYRHLLAAETEKLDSESGLTHMAHAAWNAMALVELDARRQEGAKDMTATEISKRMKGGSMNNGIGGLGPA